MKKGFEIEQTRSGKMVKMRGKKSEEKKEGKSEENERTVCG